jgi:hypothetical protein
MTTGRISAVVQAFSTCEGMTPAFSEWLGLSSKAAIIGSKSFQLLGVANGGFSLVTQIAVLDLARVTGSTRPILLKNSLALSLKRTSFSVCEHGGDDDWTPSNKTRVFCFHKS